MQMATEELAGGVTKVVLDGRHGHRRRSSCGFEDERDRRQ